MVKEEHLKLATSCHEKANVKTPMFIEAYEMSDISLCDRIIAYYKNSESKHLGQSNLGYNTDIKESMDCSIIKDSDVHDKFMDHLFTECIAHYNTKYEYAGQLNLSLLRPPNIQHYEPGGGFKVWHTERTWPQKFKEKTTQYILRRHLVFLTYLNDVEGEGGETEFYYQDFKVKPKKGLTVIFPAEWMFTHRGVPAVTESKTVVTGWLSHSFADDRKTT